MKIYLTKLLLFIFSAVVFTSCQKEISTQNGILPTQTGPVNTLPADSNYLDKILSIESNAGIPDSAYMVFNYDQQKRVSTVVIKAVSGSPDSLIFGKFFYNGNDSLPYYVHDEIDSSEYYFYYNAQNKLIRDSAVNYNTGSGGTDFIQVTGFTYSGNKIYITAANSITGPLNLTPANKDTFTLDNQGNILQANFYLKDFFTGNYDPINKVTSTFDNNFSPYLKAPAYKMFLFAYNIPFDNFDNVLTANNLQLYIDNVYSTSGGVTTLDHTRQDTYTNYYNLNGFLKHFVSVSAIPGVDNFDETYFYKSL